ncbi:MAG: uracil-DNA glycosylase [Candidatus Colwellbacteria bacterium]|nr:uracil-DNA glycosylase [Candidatus Colwellbacteria bacterium]
MITSPALEELKAQISSDSSLPLQTNLVFGEGNPKAEVVFVGEAPGASEDEQKRPFVGRAGQLLNKLIEGVGWSRERVYITNIVKRRPPENRDPLPEEIEAYKPYLEQELAIINPKVIVPLGRFSMSYFLPNGKISRDQGNVFLSGGTLIMPMYHPAAALRNPNLIKDLQDAFSKLPKLIEKHKEIMEGKQSEEENTPEPPRTLF